MMEEEWSKWRCTLNQQQQDSISTYQQWLDASVSTSKQSNKFREELHIQDEKNEIASCTIQVKEIKRKAKSKEVKQLK